MLDTLSDRQWLDSLIRECVDTSSVNLNLSNSSSNADIILGHNNRRLSFDSIQTFEDSDDDNISLGATSVASSRLDMYSVNDAAQITTKSKKQNKTPQYRAMYTYLASLVHAQVTDELDRERATLAMNIQESKDKLGASLADISVIEGNEETQSISDVTLMIQWHQHLCERIFNLHEGVRLRYSKAFSCINAEINAHHNQTLSLLRRNRQLADGLELMREITSAGPSDRVMTILQNTQNRLTQTQEQLYSIRSLLHLQSGSSNSTASSLSPKVETDPSTNTSSTQDDSAIILKATKACDDLIDNERSLQFARLSLLAEKKMLDAAIHIGGITSSEMKALQYRVDRVGVHISKYDSRITTTKQEYENIRGQYSYLYFFMHTYINT